MSEEIKNDLERLRVEVQRGTAEVRSDLRDGFQRVDDRMLEQSKKLVRHSERIAALDRRKRGPSIGAASGGYPTLLPVREPQPWWVTKIVWPGVAALAGVLATKGLPPLLATLAELMK